MDKQEIQISEMELYKHPVDLMRTSWKQDPVKSSS